MLISYLKRKHLKLTYMLSNRRLLYVFNAILYNIYFLYHCRLSVGVTMKTIHRRKN